MVSGGACSFGVRPDRCAGFGQAADPYGALNAPVAVPFEPYEIRLGVNAHDPVSPEKGSADIMANCSTILSA